MHRIFISSVQKEFAEVRKLLKRYILRNPAYHQFFETFVFEEDVVSADRRTDEVYLEELGKSDIYLGILGNQYGSEDAEGVSPTEREFDAATAKGMRRLIFIQGYDDSVRHAKELAFIKKLSPDLVWAQCAPAALLSEIYASLDALLIECGAYRMGPFDASACDGATLDDIDSKRVARFVRTARHERKLDLAPDATVEEVFTHFKLFAPGTRIPSNAGVLLFGGEPQRFHISSEVKCVHWRGVERHKPLLSYQIYKGTLFEMADRATEFVLSRIDYAVGTRAQGITAPREYEIPQSVVMEAIINAIAHRDYRSTGSVQVELFSDRLVVCNPGTINPALTPAELYLEHSSFPNNPIIADPLFYTKHIEKLGSGLTDLLADCDAAGLAIPKIEVTTGTFKITIFRKAVTHEGTPAFNPSAEPLNEPLNEPLKVQGATGLTMRIYEMICSQPGIKQKDLILKINCSAATVKRQMGILKDHVEYQGSKKTGGYFVKPPRLPQ